MDAGNLLNLWLRMATNLWLPVYTSAASLLLRGRARRRVRELLLIILAMMLQAAERSQPPARIVIQTDDVTRFFHVLDASAGKPSADDLQRGYLDAGTDALRSFTDSRIGSMERLAKAIRDTPALFAKARTCATALPSIRMRVAAAVDQLGTLLPSAALSPGHRTGGPRQQWWRDRRSRRGHWTASAVRRRLDAGRCRRPFRAPDCP